jgi:hypothetical protein
MITPGTSKCPNCEEDPYTPKETYSPEEMKGKKILKAAH